MHAAVLGGGELLAARRGPPGPGRVLHSAPGSSSSTRRTGSTGSRARLHRSLRARAGHTRTPAARSCSTRGRRSTSTTTSTGCASSPTPRPRSAWSASSSTTAGSAAAATTAPGWATGRSSTGRLARRPAARSSTTSRASAWSSGCGSSRRWSTPTPTSCAPTPTGCSARAPGRPRQWRHQQVLDLANPEACAHIEEQIGALVTELRHRLHQVGPQPRPASRRCARTRPARTARPCTPRPLAFYRLLDELRAAPPRPGDRVLLPAAAPGSTSACWRAPTGSGPATATTPSSAPQIQRWTALLVPPELMGTHIGPATRAHHPPHARPVVPDAAGPAGPRRARVGHRARARRPSSRPLAAWSALYRELRGLLHSGDPVRVDVPDDGAAGDRHIGSRPAGGALQRGATADVGPGCPGAGAAARAGPRPHVLPARADRGGHPAYGPDLRRLPGGPTRSVRGCASAARSWRSGAATSGARPGPGIPAAPHLTQCPTCLRPPAPPAHPGSSPACSRPATPSTSATTSVRWSTGWACRTTTTPLLRRRPARADRADRARGAAAPHPGHRRAVPRRRRRPRALRGLPARATSPSTPSWPGCSRCLTGFGEASRMTQFKDKTRQGPERQRRPVHLPGADGGGHPACTTPQLRAGRGGPAPAPRDHPRPGPAVQRPLRGDVRRARSRTSSRRPPRSWTCRTRRRR